jgi:hypothetical protein
VRNHEKAMENVNAAQILREKQKGNKAKASRRKSNINEDA